MLNFKLNPKSKTMIQHFPRKKENFALLYYIIPILNQIWFKLKSSIVVKIVLKKRSIYIAVLDSKIVLNAGR